MSKYTVSEYDGYALIVKDGRDMNSEEVADELNYLDKERANRDKTLSDIAQALGLEKGDVDGIGAAIEGLKQQLEQYHCALVNIVACVDLPADLNNAACKALAAGEAGNVEQ